MLYIYVLFSLKSEQEFRRVFLLAVKALTLHEKRYLQLLLKIDRRPIFFFFKSLIFKFKEVLSQYEIN